MWRSWTTSLLNHKVLSTWKRRVQRQWCSQLCRGRTCDFRCVRSWHSGLLCFVLSGGLLQCPCCLSLVLTFCKLFFIVWQLPELIFCINKLPQKWQEIAPSMSSLSCGHGVTGLCSTSHQAEILVSADWVLTWKLGVCSMFIHAASSPFPL